jgi:hypothetical protein
MDTPLNKTQIAFNSEIQTSDGILNHHIYSPFAINFSFFNTKSNNKRMKTSENRIKSPLMTRKKNFLDIDSSGIKINWTTSSCKQIHQLEVNKSTFKIKEMNFDINLSLSK